MDGKKKPVIQQQAKSQDKHSITGVDESRDDIDPGQIAAATQPSLPRQADPPPAAIVPRASDSIEWSSLAYELGLQGLAQEIAINSVVESFEQNRICLKLQPEILELMNATIREEITQAINSKLGVSLKLDLLAQELLEVETPQQARNRELEEQRQAAIDAIRKEDIVRKLHGAFGAELIESSVKKVDV
ncbi:MAG: DNA polymerase III subunit gamma/tau C-terminal domain-containing protein [Gammaproteobacteria bacterium]